MQEGHPENSQTTCSDIWDKTTKKYYDQVTMLTIKKGGIIILPVFGTIYDYQDNSNNNNCNAKDLIIHKRNYIQVARSILCAYNDEKLL